MKKTLRYFVPALLVVCFLGFSFVTHTPTVEAQEFGSSWTGQYFNNASLSGSPSIARLDSAINFNWGANSPIIGTINADNFSVRWNSFISFDQGAYRFTAVADDGIRVIIDGTVVIDNFVQTNTVTTSTADVNITAGSREIVVEYVEFTGSAAVQFFWEPISQVGAGGGAPVEATPTQGPTALPPIPPGALTATVIRAGVLNVRDAPSTGGNVVGRILRGQTYAVTGRNADATWFVLQLGGYEAWAYGYYLFINGNEFNPPIRSATSIYGIPPGFNDTGVLIQTMATMRLRAEPNVFSPQTGRITWGAIIPVSAQTPGGDWYQVLWLGTVGWVFTGFSDVVQGDAANIPVVNP